MEFLQKSLSFSVLFATVCAHIEIGNVPFKASETSIENQHTINLPAISEVATERTTLGNSRTEEILEELGFLVNAKVIEDNEEYRHRKLRRLKKREVEDLDNATIIEETIRVFYESLENRIYDVYGFETRLFDDVDVFRDLQTNLKYPKHPSAEVVDKLRQLHIEMPEKKLAVEIDSKKLHEAFERVVNYLDEQDQFYTFLGRMHERLSMYDAQENRENLKNQAIFEMCAWKQSPTHAALKEFVESMDEIQNDLPYKLLTEYESIKNIPINKPKSDIICKLLRISLESTVTTTCHEDGRMQIAGDIVKLSDVTNYCPGELKVLEIFALNRVYLDKDLDERNKKLQMAIIAPSWELVGEKTCEAAMSFHNWTTEFRSWLCQPSQESKESLFWFLRCDNPMLQTFSANHYWRFCNKRAGDDPTNTIAQFKTLCNLDGIIRPSTDPRSCPTTFVTKNGNGRLAFLYEFIQKRCTKDIKLYCELKERQPANDNLKDLTLNYINKSPVHRLIDLSGNRIDKYPVRRIPKPNGGLKVVEKHGPPGDPGKPGGNFLGIGQQFFDLNKLMILTDGGQGGTGMSGRAGKPSHIVSEKRGGDGGQGGRGGKAGTIQILQVDKYYQTERPNLRSSDGVNGFAGFGGWAGGTNVIQDPFQVGGFFGRTGANTNGTKEPESSVIYRRLPTIVNDYKLFLAQNIHDKWRKYTLNNMYENINNDETITNAYNTLDFVNELINLETAYLAESGHKNFLPFYNSFLKRIHEYMKQHGGGSLSKDQEKVSLYLQAAVLSKICVLKDRSKDNLVIRIRKLLDTVMDEINLLQETQADAAIQKYNDDYHQEVDQKIVEADKFLKNIVIPETQYINQQIDAQIEIFIEQTKNVKEQITANRKALRLTMGLKKGFAILDKVLQVMSMFPNVATEFRSALSFINNHGPRLIPAIEEDKMPIGVKKLLGDIRPHFQRFANAKGQVLDELMDILDTDKTGLLADTRQQIADIKNKMKILTDNKEFKTVKEILDNKGKQLLQSAATKDNKDALNVLDKAQNDLRVAQQSVSTYLKHKNNKTSMLKLISSMLLLDEDKDVKALGDFETKIFETLIPMMNNMRADVSNIVHNLNGESLAALDVIKWRTMNALKEISRKLQNYTIDFTVKEPLAVWMDKLNEAMNTVIKIYERKQNYLEHLRLADYIAQIHSAGMKGVTSQDKELSRALVNLRLIVQSNVVLGQHKRAINAFKQYMFPFASIDLRKFDLKPYNMSMDITNRVNHAVNQLNALKSEIDKSDYLLVDHKESIWTGDFDSRTRRSNGPFFTWTNETNAESLAKLLSGETVILRADISNGFDANAIKFRKIGIRFVTADKNIAQSELDEALEIFDAHMTHMGNSYYRCDDKCYLMTSKDVTIKYSFQLNDAGQPVDNNQAYELIGEGDFMLSPYALWSFKLSTRNRKHFADLIKYKKRVNLELQGYGKYIEVGNNICNSNNLDLYYQKIACT